MPAKFVRNLTPDEIAKIKEAALDNVEVRLDAKNGVGGERGGRQEEVVEMGGRS